MVIHCRHQPGVTWCQRKPSMFHVPAHKNVAAPAAQVALILPRPDVNPMSTAAQADREVWRASRAVTSAAGAVRAYLGVRSVA